MSEITENIQTIISGIADLKSKMQPYNTLKRELEKELYCIENSLKNKAVFRHNEEYASLIDKYYTESADNKDAKVNFNTMKVIVETDCPRTRHPYDKSISRYTIAELEDDNG